MTECIAIVCVFLCMHIYIGTLTVQGPTHTYAGDRRQEIVFIGIDMDQVWIRVYICIFVIVCGSCLCDSERESERVRECVRE